MGQVNADPAAAEGRPGHPRTPEAAARLARYEDRMSLPIILAAVLPLVVTTDPTSPVNIAVAIVSWLVFLYDFIVHQNLTVSYLRTGRGKFDLAIVVLTFPFYLLPGGTSGSYTVILRLARLARVVMAGRGGRRLFSRLGRVAAVAGGVLLLASLVAYRAENPVNSEFATVGDSLWWGVVTLTTVGYGDITPITTTGRWAGVAIMVTGIAVLGVLAGSLASFFKLSPAEEAAERAADGEQPAVMDVASEVAALRSQIQLLDARLEQLLQQLPPS
jgi:voltage-gated potassium channel